MNVIIAAGGTGGHVFPAQALAVELIARGHKCKWIGRPDSLESRTAQDTAIAFHPVRMSGLRGKRLDKQLIALWQCLVASISLVLWMRRQSRKLPSLVVTFGGYTSVAAGIAAWCTRLPLIIHEQNSFAGSSNRLLARWANAVCCGFDSVFPQLPHRHYLGNPIRSQRTPSYRKDTRPLRLLVLGGSLGAASLNQAVCALLTKHRLIHPLHLVHQCGTTSYQQTRSAYLALAANQPLLRLRLQTFLQRIDWYYPWCDLIICRAGAITLAEVTQAGKYALLVPFPHATDNHQWHNAKALVSSGGASLLQDDARLPNNLAQAILPLLQQPAAAARTSLHPRGKLLYKLARPDAARAMADLVETMQPDPA